MACGEKAISFLSGEWILASGRPNGGDVVVYRTLWVGAFIILAVAAVRSTQSTPATVCDFLRCVWLNALKTIREPEGLVVFGAVYAALYARFTSQWTYMANLYNQIKQAEVTGSSITPPAIQATALSEWKAGFIEDAIAVHMATKPTIASIIRVWYQIPDVRRAFHAHTQNPEAKVGWLKAHKVLA